MSTEHSALSNQHSAKELHWEASVTLGDVCVVAFSANPNLNVLQEVADAKRYWTVEQRMEHVRLAAAAPDLLRALKKIHRSAERAYAALPVDTLTAELILQLSADLDDCQTAINKAERRS